MWGDLIGILALSVLCVGWVLVQRFFARHDPDAPGVEGQCGSCGAGDNCDKRDHPGGAHA